VLDISIADHVRIGSGALGGILDARIEVLSLVYVTVRTDDGPLKIPNSAMLASGICEQPRDGPVPPLATDPRPQN
jgi:small-conductance mechanosensitive channel